MIGDYVWPGGREPMLRFGPADTDGAVVLLLLPLFEEHNRTRAFAVTLLRSLSDLGMGSALIELPGQGESMVPTEQATLEAWRLAARSAVAAQGAVRPVHLASMRGSAIVDSAPGTSSVWRLAPVPGSAVLNDLMRAEAVSGRRNWDSFTIDSPPARLIGNPIDWALFDGLRADTALVTPPVPLRTVRLESDPAAADVKYPGTPLWRRSEPGNDSALAAVLAQDLADWVRQCAG